MKKIILLILFCLIVSGCIVVSGCTAKNTVYRAPDETKVQERKNLVLPPDYELRPPKEEKKK